MVCAHIILVRQNVNFELRTTYEQKKHLGVLSIYF